MPVHLKISELSNDGRPDELIFDHVMETKAVYAHKSGEFGREIATINLHPGLYRVVANTLSDHPEFADGPASITIDYYANLKFVWPTQINTLGDK